MLELIGPVARIASHQFYNSGNTPPYYWVRIELAAEVLARLCGLEIRPGMPAEAMMTAQHRAVLNYFLKHLTDQLIRALRLSSACLNAGRYGSG